MSRVSPQFLSQDVLNVQQVRDQQFRFINIIPAFQDNESAMQFLARLGLLRNHVPCGGCGNPCLINAYAHGTDGFRWRCNAHNFTQSIRADSPFSQKSFDTIPVGDYSVSLGQRLSAKRNCLGSHVQQTHHRRLV